MSTFSTLTTELNFNSLQINISNLEISDIHWRSPEFIARTIQDLEMLLYRAPNFELAENDLIQFLLSLNKRNPRIASIKFYTDINTNAFVCACICDIPNFKPENFLKRNISCKFLKQNKSIIFTDINNEEWGDIDKKLPLNWLLNEALTKKYSKYTKLFL